MKENKEIQNLLLTSYPVPFIGDDYRINVYQYGEDDVKDVLYSKYCEDMPREYLAGQPSIADIPALCLDKENELAVFINTDLVDEEDRMFFLLENLFFVGISIADDLESEEFGARVVGDCFLKIAPLFSQDTSSAEKSSLNGMSVYEYAIPLIHENYRVTLNMYDDDTTMDVVMALRETYRAKMLVGGFHPANNRGFVAEPSADELAVFVNNSVADSLLMQETILAHELFHAARRIATSLEGGEKLGAKIYITLFEKFVAFLCSQET